MPLIKKDMPFNQCELVSHFEQLKKIIFVIVNVIIMGFNIKRTLTCSKQISSLDTPLLKTTLVHVAQRLAHHLKIHSIAHIIFGTKS